jgi:hypothetical protein
MSELRPLFPLGTVLYPGMIRMAVRMNVAAIRL